MHIVSVTPPTAAALSPRAARCMAPPQNPCASRAGEAWGHGRLWCHAGCCVPWAWHRIVGWLDGSCLVTDGRPLKKRQMVMLASLELVTQMR